MPLTVKLAAALRFLTGAIYLEEELVAVVAGFSRFSGYRFRGTAFAGDGVFLCFSWQAIIGVVFVVSIYSY